MAGAQEPRNGQPALPARRAGRFPAQTGQPARREQLSVPSGNVSVGKVKRRALHGRQEEAARMEARAAL